METPPILPVKTGAPQPRRTGRGKYAIISLVGIILLGAILYGTLRRKDTAVTVQTEKITRHNITETVIANGKIYPVLQVHISAEVSGEIIELAVKEGQYVHKGDFLLKINPKTPLAMLNQAKASLESSRSSVATATANLEKADTDFTRNKELYDHKLISESDFIGFKVALDIARAQLNSASHSVELAQGSVDSAQDSFDKTTIAAPLDGTITVLNSQLGERVLGTVQNAGTEIMTISDLSKMEARVDIGEMDIVLLQVGQKARLEVDSYKDKKFAGLVTAVARSSKDMNSSALGAGSGSSSSGQSATQFQVRIRLTEENELRPGMSVNAIIETRTHTNVIAAPIASVTTRVLKSKSKPGDAAKTNTMANAASTNFILTNGSMAEATSTNATKGDKKGDEKNKPVEVVFVLEGDHVKTVPVKIGIFDDDYYEITDGLKEGDEIVTGGFHAISHDLDDGKKTVKGTGGNGGKDAEPNKS